MLKISLCFYFAKFTGNFNDTFSLRVILKLYVILGYRKNTISGSRPNGNSSENGSEGYKTPESSGYGSTVLNKKRKKNIFSNSIIDKALPLREKKR